MSDISTTIIERMQRYLGNSVAQFDTSPVIRFTPESESVRNSLIRLSLESIDKCDNGEISENELLHIIPLADETLLVYANSNTIDALERFQHSLKQIERDYEKQIIKSHGI